MKIYLAGPEPHNLKESNIRACLLSFYDIYISNIPFRKVTFKLILKKYENK